MISPFRYSDTNKRYYTYDYFLKQKFGGKCVKIMLDCGFTCPNIDGSKGVGGCTYCSGRGSGDFAESAQLSVAEQFSAVRERMYRKWDGAHCIAYFQAHTNTYAPLPRLKQLYEEALAQPDVVGLNIATRADCISDETAEYLRELSMRTFLTVELGLQSVYDETAKRINRCHTYEEFLRGYEKLRGINVCIHIINGLPGEDRERMLATAEEVGRLHPQSVKIHLLHVLRGTKLAEEYERGAFSVLSLEEYTDIVCSQLERLPEDMVIGRITGDGAASDLIAPLWSLKKFVCMNEIDKELVRRDSYQGKLCKVYK